MGKNKFELGLLVGLLALLAVTGEQAVSDIGDSMQQGIIDKIAYAIAWAEGFFVAGSRPARNHNPGDFKRDLIGKAVGSDGTFVVYASDADGWENLKHQVALFFGGSHIYNPNMTIAEVAFHYAEGDPAWAANVASQLGVSVDTRLVDLTA